MKKILITTLLLIVSFNSFAQDAKSWRASVGIGYGVKKNLRLNNRYEDMDKKFLTKPLPFIQGSVGRLSLGAQGISFMVAGNHLMNGSVYITRSGDRYQGDGMRPRKDSAFVGASAKFFKYGLSIARDINGRSKGYTANLNYGEFYKINEEIMLRAGLSLEWNDDRYAEYYYGVRHYEASATRREYHLTNYFQPGINFMPIYKLSEKSSIITAVNFKLLPKKVWQSPTMTGKKVEMGGFVAYSYQL